MALPIGTLCTVDEYRRVTVRTPGNQQRIIESGAYARVEVYPTDTVMIEGDYLGAEGYSFCRHLKTGKHFALRDQFLRVLNLK